MPAWNPAAWFGSQLGCTLWLLLGAVVLLPRAPVAGLVWLGAFGIATILGVTLWMSRERRTFTTASILYVVALGVLASISLVAADWFGELVRLAQPMPNAAAYAMLLIFPVLIVMHLILARARRAE